MTKILATIGVILLMASACSRKEKSGLVARVSFVKSDTTQSNVDFDKDIKSILKTHCTPCHFPGGSMYVKMPFDSPQTIVKHQAGIYRRIKDPEELKKIRAFVEQKI